MASSARAARAGICAGALLGVALIAACSGGGGGSARAPHPAASATGAASSATSRTLTLQLKIPKRTTLQALARGRSRAPKWISASTQGAAITITANGTPGTTDFNLAPVAGASPAPDGYGSATCATASDGSTTCTLVVPFAAFGSNLAVLVQLYDTPPPFSAANEVASGTVATTISLTEGANIVVPVVLSGVVSTLEAADVVSIPAGGGTGSFLLEGFDADGNIILASDGAAGPNDRPATFNLSIPPSITGVTLTDQTTTAAGSGVTTLANANIGDTIAVTATGTPAFVGVPLDATIEDQAPADLGNVYAPVAMSSAAPYTVASVSPPVRIAGATFASSYNGGAQANGFVTAYLGSSPFYPPTVTSYTVSGGTTPSASQSGTYSLDSDYNDDTITDLIALGNANDTSGATTPGLYFAGYFSDNALVSGPLTPSTNNGSLNISGQETTASDLGAGSAAFTASEDAGGYVGTAANVVGTSYVSIAPEAAGNAAPGGSLTLISGSSAPISIAATIDGTTTVGENPLFVVLTSGYLYAFSPKSSVPNVTVALPTGGGTPVSIVAQGPYAWVLTSSGGINTCPIYRNFPVGCSYVPNVVTNPSTDRHAMALGPDGELWIATTTTIIRYNPATGAETPIGNNDYAQIVASADGRLYAVTTSGEIDAIP